MNSVLLLRHKAARRAMVGMQNMVPPYSSRGNTTTTATLIRKLIDDTADNRTTNPTTTMGRSLPSQHHNQQQHCSSNDEYRYQSSTIPRRRWFSSSSSSGGGGAAAAAEELERDTTTTSATAGGVDSTALTNIIKDSNHQILSFALQGDAASAQRVLEELEQLLLMSTTSTSHTADNDNNAAQKQQQQKILQDYYLLEGREAVLDAWITHQTNLYNEWQKQQQQQSTDGSAAAAAISDTSDLDNNEEEERPKSFRGDIFYAAKQAHQALEKTIPFLAKPAVAVYMQHHTHHHQRSSSSSKRGDVYDEQTILEDPEGVLGKLEEKTSNNNNPLLQMRRCNTVLTAWARASQVLSTNHTNDGDDDTEGDDKGRQQQRRRKHPKKKQNRHGIPQRAQYLVQRMEAASSSSAGSSSSSSSGSGGPTIESYNRVLESWAYSSEHLRATMAEQIFQYIQRHNRLRANGDSYKFIIQAWCNSNQRKDRSHMATTHLTKWLRRLEKGREEIEPTIETYRMVMKSWSHSEERNAPMKALGLLRLMESAYYRKYCTVAPDETCYKYYLMASAKKSLVPEQGPLAMQLLRKLKQRQTIPDQDCYTAAIRIWKNSAFNPLFAENREQAITNTVDLLQEFALARHRSSTVSVQPTTANYNDVLETLASSRKSVSKTIGETLVKVMEDSSTAEQPEQRDRDIRPNWETYQWLLTIYARSRSPDKLQAAKRALERMKGRFTTAPPIISGEEDGEAVQEEEEEEEENTAGAEEPKDRTSIDPKAVVGVYNAFLRVCGSAAPAQQDDRMNILQEALGSIQEMRSSYGLKPNSRTYSSLLDVCKRHLEVGAERNRIIQSIFDGCCEEGLVDEGVLKSLKAATSDDQYSRLVLSVSKGVEGTRMVPEEWSSNVGGQRKVTASGRKAAPLSVDGKFTVTKAMKEYRMRKLRSKVNQKVLQGGRLKLDPKKRGEAIRIELDEEALSKVN